MIEVDEKFKKRFPNIYRELQEGLSVRIDAVRSSEEEAEKAARTLENYDPTVIDFIRRCDTEEQALEIINYMEKRGEITSEYAKRLREQLVRDGVRSFGKKREPGCYERGDY
ncbi:MAG: DUF2095 family protein [Candidatus Hadarchaeales archaeon]